MIEQRPVDDAPTQHPPPRGTLREVAAVFTLLGFTAFGGPAAHTAMIEDQVVTRRKWVTRQHFLDIVSAINFIPGPNSTELVMHLGHLRAGLAGLFVAGACFITPAMLIILPIAWMYVTYGTLPRVANMMAMISCAVVAIVAMASWRFAEPIMRQPRWLAVALFSAGLAWVVGRFTPLQPELVVLAFAAAAGIVITRLPRRIVTLPSIAPLPLAAVIPLAETSGSYVSGIAALCLFLLKVGATLFGSGYVLVSYLHSGLVIDHRWMTDQQLLDAIAVGQFTPGPLLTTATFIGYVLGHGAFAGGHGGAVLGAVLATMAIFLPSFLLVMICGPILQRLRTHPIARAALDGMNAAVAALLVMVCLQLADSALRAGGMIGALVMVASALALWLKWNATWTIIGAIMIGLLVR